MNDTGTIAAIYTAVAGGVEPVRHEAIVLEAAKGIVGDRYYAGTGTFSAKLKGKPKKEITFIEAEEIARFNREQGCAVPQGALRRNVITQGVRLNALVGKEFSIGGLRFRGIELCEPCAYLARTVEAKVLPHLVGRAGLRAQILTSGTLALGARFELD